MQLHYLHGFSEEEVHSLVFLGYQYTSHSKCQAIKYFNIAFPECLSCTCQSCGRLALVLNPTAIPLRATSLPPSVHHLLTILCKGQCQWQLEFSHNSLQARRAPALAATHSLAGRCEEVEAPEGSPMKHKRRQSFLPGHTPVAAESIHPAKAVPPPS